MTGAGSLPAQNGLPAALAGGTLHPPAPAVCLLDGLPPPHAGTSRPGPYCAGCGGHRGPHTVHHDQAAHDRARRRYDGPVRQGR
jgi:hypothetical protein